MIALNENYDNRNRLMRIVYRADGTLKGCYSRFKPDQYPTPEDQAREVVRLSCHIQRRHFDSLVSVGFVETASHCLNEK